MPRRTAPLFLLALALPLLGGCATSGAGPSSSQGVPTASGPAAAPFYPGWTDQTVGSSELVPILVSSELAVGPNRFLLSLADQKNNIIASPAVGVALRFFELARSTDRPASERQGVFVAIGETDRGLYRARVDFPRPGDWGVQVEASGPRVPDWTARVVFTVRDKSQTPAIGAPAPPSETPTATDRAGIAKISTDDDPDPAFYRSSVADAVSSGKPAVIVFATPKFCTSQVCGPTLDVVKSVAPPFEDRVTFIHVEVYTNLDQPDQLETVPAVGEWGLPTEPWVFVLDREGRIADKFEGIVGADELEESIKAVLAAA